MRTTARSPTAYPTSRYRAGGNVSGITGARHAFISGRRGGAIEMDCTKSCCPRRLKTDPVSTPEF
jgi:hypothetical protein